MKACHEATDGEVVAIDGKTVRSSYDKSKRKGPIPMVSTFATANGVVLGQIKTEEKAMRLLPFLICLNCWKSRDVSSLLMPWAVSVRLQRKSKRKKRTSGTDEKWTTGIVGNKYFISRCSSCRARVFMILPWGFIYFPCLLATHCWC